MSANTPDSQEDKTQLHRSHRTKTSLAKSPRVIIVPLFLRTWVSGVLASQGFGVPSSAELVGRTQGVPSMVGVPTNGQMRFPAKPSAKLPKWKTLLDWSERVGCWGENGTLLDWSERVGCWATTTGYWWRRRPGYWWGCGSRGWPSAAEQSWWPCGGGGRRPSSFSSLATLFWRFVRVVLCCLFVLFVCLGCRSGSPFDCLCCAVLFRSFF